MLQQLWRAVLFEADFVGAAKRPAPPAGSVCKDRRHQLKTDRQEECLAGEQPAVASAAGRHAHVLVVSRTCCTVIPLVLFWCEKVPVFQMRQVFMIECHHVQCACFNGKAAFAFLYWLFVVTVLVASQCSRPISVPPDKLSMKSTVHCIHASKPESVWSACRISVRS